MDGKKRLEELASRLERGTLPSDIYGRQHIVLSAADIRSISDAYKAMEERAEKAETALAAEERRSEELLKRLDKARAGNEPDFCYDPDEWEFTSLWSERDQVHGDGEGIPLGGVMEVATLIRGPRKWVARVPISWGEDGEPDDMEIEWFDSEDSAHAALTRGLRHER